MSNRILITGANGFLGSRLYEYFRGRKDCEALGITHRELEISDSLAVSAFVKAIRPDYVLHCAGISNTRTCEEDPERSEQINVRGTANIARVCRESGAKMIFMSSDQIYNATCSQEPNREDQIQKPCTVYGRDKKRAEEAVFTCLTDAVALRLTWMYDYPSEKGKGSGLLGNLVSALWEKRIVELPVHEYRGITYVWEGIPKIEAALSLPGGIYNFGSENDKNTFDTAALFLQEITGREDVSSVIRKNRERFLASPRNLTMDISKIRKFGIDFASSNEGIRACLSDYQCLIKSKNA